MIRSRSGSEATIDFEGLSISFDHRVLQPRPWTAGQSRWAAALLETLPPGPVLDLCAGAGQIGLAAVIRTSRRLVMVDAEPVAAAFATANARAAGLSDRVEVRMTDLTGGLVAGEEFALVIADPPWVRRGRTHQYPEDPLAAIDGGPDGLDVARACLEVIGVHLAAEGAALLQLGSAQQAEALGREIEGAGLCTTEIRSYVGGVVAHLERPGRRSELT
jgi:methylase of polypeptide subunit release factors